VAGAAAGASRGRGVALGCWRVRGTIRDFPGGGARGSPWLSLPWSYVGLPAAAIPAGAIGGLPVGLQLVGGWHADEELLERAVALEHDVDFPTLPAAARQPRPQSFSWW
jgi:hypothetical protein